MQPADNGPGAGGSQAGGLRELRRRTRHRSGTPESARRFTRYVLVPALVLGVLALIGSFSFRPARARLREWRSVKVVAEAEAALQSGNPGEAYRKVEVALQLAPARTEVRRAAARIHTAVGSPEAVAHWQSVLGAPCTTTEDRLAYIDGCLRFQRADLASYVALLLNRDLDDAGRIADELANRPGASPGSSLVAAFGRVRLGKPTEAIDLLGRTGIDPASLNPRSQVMLAVIRDAAGQRSSARQLAREIPREALKAEERLLLEKLD